MYNIKDFNIADIKYLTDKCETKEEFLSIIDSYIERNAINEGDWIRSKSDRQNVYKVVNIRSNGGISYYTVESFFFRGPCKIFGDFVKIDNEIEALKYDSKLEKAKEDWK